MEGLYSDYTMNSQKPIKRQLNSKTNRQSNSKINKKLKGASKRKYPNGLLFSSWGNEN